MIGRRKEVMKVIQQLFVERGFLETSVQDILQAANISKGTFYNYFSSKNDCLIAILKQAQKEAFLRRKQLLLDGKEDDREVFVKQILIRLHLNKEQNLLPLLGSLFHSKDEELREFAKQYHLQELTWLTGRFIQIYGRNIKPVAIDCAVSLQGLLQQYSLVWSYYSKKEVHAK